MKTIHDRASVLGAIFVTEGSCAVPISKVKRHIPDGLLPLFVGVCTSIRTVAEVNEQK